MFRATDAECGYCAPLVFVNVDNESGQASVTPPALQLHWGEFVSGQWYLKSPNSRQAAAFALSASLTGCRRNSVGIQMLLDDNINIDDGSKETPNKRSNHRIIILHGDLVCDVNSLAVRAAQCHADRFGFHSAPDGSDAWREAWARCRAT